MADPLLDLTTLIEQPTIKIDGVQYPILHPDQLGVLDFQRLSIMAGSVSALMKKSGDEITDEDVAELTRIIEDLTDRIMVGVPAEKRTGLTESQRLEVAEVFMTLPRAQSRKTRKKKSMTPSQAQIDEMRKQTRSAGSRPRSDASDSTAEARPDG
jgi:hypothetical protein